jgi:hypothetical protein
MTTTLILILMAVLLMIIIFVYWEDLHALAEPDPQTEDKPADDAALWAIFRASQPAPLTPETFDLIDGAIYLRTNSKRIRAGTK